MLVSISGPSSCGKGTLLFDLESRGFDVLHNRYARMLLNDIGLTVEQLYQQPFPKIQQFHRVLVSLKKFHEREFVQSSSIIYVERSFIDFYVYQTVMTGQEDTELFDICLDTTLAFYHKCIFLEECPCIEDDGIRVTNAETINKQKILFKHISSTPHFISKSISIPSLDRTQRVETVIKTISDSLSL